jgi:hypothetical protein
MHMKKTKLIISAIYFLGNIANAQQLTAYEREVIRIENARLELQRDAHAYQACAIRRQFIDSTTWTLASCLKLYGVVAPVEADSANTNECLHGMNFMGVCNKR